MDRLEAWEYLKAVLDGKFQHPVSQGSASAKIRMKRKSQFGFSLLELLIVLGIAMIVMAMATPLVMNGLNVYYLRQAGANYTNLLQNARMRAVQDDQFYRVAAPGPAILLSVPGPNAGAYVDINGDGAYTPPGPGVAAEPMTLFEGRIAFGASPPAITNLRSQYLPSGCAIGTCVLPNPQPGVVTFGPRGLPCTAPAGSATCSYLSAGVAVSFETFFRNTRTAGWESVTVNPAGRIRQWDYDPTSSTWKALN